MGRAFVAFLDNMYNVLFLYKNLENMIHVYAQSFCIK